MYLPLPIISLFIAILIIKFLRSSYNIFYDGEGQGKEAELQLLKEGKNPALYKFFGVLYMWFWTHIFIYMFANMDRFVE